MAKREHKIYTEEFKKEAVKLALESEQSMAQTARDLRVMCQQKIGHFLTGLLEPFQTQQETYNR